MRTALVLIAHGSRQADANDDLFALADTLRQAGGYHEVVAAFLELASPDIGEAVRKCIAAGAGRVILLPYFLSAGVHVRRDLARIRDELALEFPGIVVLLAEPLGRHPLLTRIVQERAAESTGQNPSS